ncbi:MAG: type III pantothenate kinase [Flavobacteriales bacterium]|nr:type III pantothenate kinase [Flavobacteriales bacterium]
MLLIIDIGNSRVKTAVFQGDRLLRITALAPGDRSSVQTIAEAHRFDAIAIGSVASPDPQLVVALKALAPVLEIAGNTPSPVVSAYGTPLTLGADRLANAVAAAGFFTGKAVMAIDAGTCITYDVVDPTGTYRGGAISPGMRMRAQSMHDFSARLPLVESDGPMPDHFGTSTLESLRSGVLHGLHGEIAGFMEAFRNRHPEGAVVFTGGDGLRLARAMKSGIFAHPFLTLEGYRRILVHHHPDLVGF